MPATNVVIALALILDFSGSMEQKLEDKTKRAIMSDNIGAVASSLNQQDQAFVISFGSGSSRGCDGVETQTMPVGELPAWTQKQRPGNFAATPLAKAIEAFSTTASSTGVTRALIITDGQDTCGQNPCDALERMDQKLTQQLRVDLLGYDLESRDASKLKCEKSNFKNILFKAYFAASDTEFAQQLETIEAAARAAVIAADDASLEIQSAPATARFMATYKPKRQSRKKTTVSPQEPVFDVHWKGAYAVQLKPGDYEITAPDFEGARAKMTVTPGERRQVNFYGLFRLPKAVLKLKDDHVLGIEASPLDGQNRGRKVKIKTPQEVELFPGRWKLSVEHPSWLSEASIDITLEPASNRNLSIADLFRKQIQWLPAPKKESVLLLRSKVREQRIYIMPEPGRFPIPRHVKWRWL